MKIYLQDIEHLLNAEYGATRKVNVTNYIKEKLGNDYLLNFTVNNNFFCFDPSFGLSKELIIEYINVDKEHIKQKFSENDNIFLINVNFRNAKVKKMNTIEQLSMITNHIQEKYKLTTFSDEGSKVAMIFESRENKFAEFYLRQFSRFIPKDWVFTMYLTENVIPFYQKIIDKLHNNIKIIKLKYPLTNVKEYNEIMLNKGFWQEQHSNGYNKVLILQFDVMMYKGGVNDFIDYDYIGAPWSPYNKITPSNIGNGGCSIRSIDFMIKSLDNMDNIKIQKYNGMEKDISRLDNIPEDVFYSNAASQLNGNLPSLFIAEKFSIEHFYYNKNNPIFTHQGDLFNKDYEELLFLSLMPYYAEVKTWFDGMLASYMINKHKKVLFMSIPNTEFDIVNTKWVGYIVNNNINSIIKNINFIKSLPKCQGIFVTNAESKIALEAYLLGIGINTILVEIVKLQNFTKDPTESCEKIIYDILNTKITNRIINLEF